jgi:ferredoxin
MPATRTLPTIEIDQEKCLSPLKCGDCLRACPAVVLMSIPKFNEKFRECSYDDFTVSVHNRPACTVCMKCVDVCPVDCIKVEYSEMAATA